MSYLVFLSKTHNSSLTLVGFVHSPQGLADNFTWKDGKGLHYTSTGHTRRMLREPPNTLHKSVLKWNRVLAWDLNLEVIWRNIWKPYLLGQTIVFSGKSCIMSLPQTTGAFQELVEMTRLPGAWPALLDTTKT